MVINKVKEQSKLTVSLRGSLDTLTASEFQDGLDLSDVKELIFNVEELDYMSSAGVRVFLACHKTMIKQGSMKICHPNSAVSEVFEITGLYRVFDIEE